MKKILMKPVFVSTVSVLYFIAMWFITRNLLQNGDDGLMGAAPFFYTVITIYMTLIGVASDEPAAVRLQGGMVIVSLIGIAFSLLCNMSLIWAMLGFCVGSFLLFCWGEMVRENK